MPIRLGTSRGGPIPFARRRARPVRVLKQGAPIFWTAEPSHSATRPSRPCRFPRSRRRGAPHVAERYSDDADSRNRRCGSSFGEITPATLTFRVARIARQSIVSQPSSIATLTSSPSAMCWRLALCLWLLRSNDHPRLRLRVERGG
jgi:hypothetical protein